MSKKTKVDQDINWFKNHPFFSKLIIIGIIIIALGAVIVAGQNIWKPVVPFIKGLFVTPSQKSFKSENSTHILILSFAGVGNEAIEFGIVIPDIIKEKLDICCTHNLKGGDIEALRLGYSVQDHKEAQDTSENLQADMCIWGKSYYSSSTHEVEFDPKVTLTRRIFPFEILDTRIVVVADQLSATKYNLDSLLGEKPAQVLNFVFGRHLFLRNKFKEAGKYFEKVGDEIYKDEEARKYIYKSILDTSQFPSKDMIPLAYYEMSQILFKKLGDQYREAEIWGVIGGVYDSLGKYDQATNSYKNSLNIVRELGNPSREAVILDNIGGVYHAWGEDDSAIAYCKKSLNIAQELGNRQLERVILNNIGNIYRACNKFDQAIEYYDSSRKIAEEIGVREEEWATTSNIASAYYNQHKYDKALEYYERCREIAKKIGDLEREKESLQNISIQYHLLGDEKHTAEFYMESKNIQKAITRKKERGTLSNLIRAIWTRPKF